MWYKQKFSEIVQIINFYMGQFFYVGQNFLRGP